MATIQLPSKSELTLIISGDALESARLTNKWGKSIGTELSKPLKAAQIRNIFGKVRQLERSWMYNQAGTGARRDMILLEPKLRYQAERKREIEDLAEVLIEAIQLVDDGSVRLEFAPPVTPDRETREKFQRFVDFFEAILAYHKAAGGK